MYEVELKVAADPSRVRRRLEELGAETLDSVVQTDTYYDAPHRSFPETDEALRIRDEERTDDPEDTYITYKGPIVDDASKTREEVETRVESGEEMDDVLVNLGFEAAATVRKDRERFELDGYTVTLDSVDGVGEFVEVETEAPEERIEEAREGACAVLERLGLDPDDQIRTSYLELALED